MGFQSTDDGIVLHLRIGGYTEQSFEIEGDMDDVGDKIKCANPFVNMIYRYDWLLRRGLISESEHLHRARACAKIVLQKLWIHRKN